MVASQHYIKTTIVMASIDLHKKRLQNLCRVCGSVIARGGKVFLVEKYIAKLKSAFWIEGLENDIGDVPPKKFCSKCYHAMFNITERGGTHSQTNIFDWVPHGESCTVCVHVNDLRRGGRKHKQKYEGLKHSLDLTVWTKDFTKELKEKIPEHRIDQSDLNLSDFDSECNPSLTPTCYDFGMSTCVLPRLYSFKI